jgi:hypothetical protein
VTNMPCSMQHVRAQIIHGASLAYSRGCFKRAPEKTGTRIAMGMNSIMYKWQMTYKKYLWNSSLRAEFLPRISSSQNRHLSCRRGVSRHPSDILPLLGLHGQGLNDDLTTTVGVHLHLERQPDCHGMRQILLPHVEPIPA